MSLLTSNNKGKTYAKNGAIKNDVPLLFQDTVYTYAPTSGQVTTISQSTLINYQIQLQPNQVLVSMLPEAYYVQGATNYTSASIANLGSYADYTISDLSNNQIIGQTNGALHAIANACFNLNDEGAEDIRKHSQPGADWVCVGINDQSPGYSTVNLTSSVVAAVGPAELYMPQGAFNGGLNIDIQGRNTLVCNSAGSATSSVAGHRLSCVLRTYNQPLPGGRPTVMYPRLRQFQFPGQATTKGSSLSFQMNVNSQLVGMFFFASTANQNWNPANINLSTKGTGTCNINTSAGQRLLSGPLCVLKNESNMSGIYVYAVEFIPHMEWTSVPVSNWVDTLTVDVNGDSDILDGTARDWTFCCITQEVATPVGSSGYNVAPLKL